MVERRSTTLLEVAIQLASSLVSLGTVATTTEYNGGMHSIFNRNCDAQCHWACMHNARSDWRVSSPVGEPIYNAALLQRQHLRRGPNDAKWRHASGACCNYETR